jgi:hypothetical protein
MAQDTTKRGVGRSKIASCIPIEREPAGGVARVRLGSYEFKKKGVSRFDLRDPYHLAVALTWPQFLAALLALYLCSASRAVISVPASMSRGRIAS